MKAVLVLDEMPDECFGCICEYDCYLCTAAQKRLEWSDLKGRPDWCPLQPLPKRKEEMDYLAAGYNKCLDDILEDD